ncbi:MAG: hypothetical protein U0Y08_04755 [Bacteroidia bacterium]
MAQSLQRFNWYLLLCILLSGEARAEYTWTANCNSAWDQLAHLNFKEADRLVALEKARRPQNLIPLYIESQADFLRTFIYEEKKNFEDLKANNEIRIRQFEKDPAVSPYQRFCIAEMYLQLTVARIKFKEYLSAAYDVRKSYKLLEENQHIYPDFTPNLRGLGLIHAAVGAVPKNYQWMASMLGLGGSIHQGLNDLRKLYTSTKSNNEYAFLREETVIMLTFLEINLGKEKDLRPIRQRFLPVKNIDQKPLMLFAKCNLHANAAENDSVIYLLSTRDKSTNTGSLPYLLYMEANARLHNLEPEAEKLYLEYLRQYKGKSYRQSCLQRMAWGRLVRGDEEGYHKFMALLSHDETAETADEDKAAVKEAVSGEMPNIILLRARLLFDGGYYPRALAEIAGKPITLFTRLKDQIEFTYRFARIMDKTGNDEKAIEFYLLTLKNGAAQTYYYAANSALLLAQLYEERGNKAKALEYYKTTLSMRNHEFQNSIDQKAKAGINRLSD